MSRIQRIAAATFAATVAVSGVVVGTLGAGAAASAAPVAAASATPAPVDRGLVITVPRNAPASLTLDQLLRPGMVFSVALYENASTGYSWNAQLALSTQETVKFLDSTYVPDSVKPIPGSGGTRYFRYRVGADQGAAGITFRYQRSWEAAPIQQVSLRIMVL